MVRRALSPMVRAWAATIGAMRANRDREGIDEPMAVLQAVLFDGDGTLIDTEGIILTSMRYTVNELHGMEASD